MNNLYASIFTLIFCVFTHFSNCQQPPTAFERSVVVEALPLSNGQGIEFTWLPDPSATGYTVFKKELEENEWGIPIASIAGSATSWIDDQALPGDDGAHEYAFFKHEFEPVSWTTCIPRNAQLRFEIKDMYGIGLCCNFGYGYYEVSACDSIYVQGDDFDWGDVHTFDLCNSTDSCVDVTVTIFPDIFPNSTSWQLFDNNSNVELASSGPVGTYIAPRPAYGFIYAGTDVLPLQEKGKILLLVDSTYLDSLKTELDQLRFDLYADGWEPIQLNISRQATVIEVKEQIKTIAQAIQPGDTKLEALYIIGHVPVPYSGDIYPDTHTEHRGAWAADSYYADLDGIWTDSIADRSTAFFSYNHNIPGDGKFDQGGIPSLVELAVGRIDFFNMPEFSKTELELLRQYLKKSSDYKNGRIKTVRRALIDDNFRAAFAAPAASGWRNFGPLVGIDSIFERDYFTAAREAPYLWVYGCGSGTHVSSMGVGSTTDFANDSLQSIFSMLFGSQFGDWDNPNNFLRAPLASGTTLTNCWAGNPPWTFHQMAMGETIGSCTKRTQNSSNGVYLPGPQMVHVALMGDPSLRMHAMETVTGLEINQVDNTVVLNWNKPEDQSIHQYAVYKKDSSGNELRLLDFNLSDTTFTDLDPWDGPNAYMVKNKKLESSPSGTYINTSLGVMDSTEVTLIISSLLEQLEQSVIIFPNPVEDIMSIQLPYFVRQGSYEIYNVWGQSIMSGNLAENNAISKVNIERLPKGIFWIVIKYDGKIYRQKIIHV